MLTVPEDQLNLGFHFEQPVANQFFNDLMLIARLDYLRFGETPWDIEGSSGAVEFLNIILDTIPVLCLLSATGPEQVTDNNADLYSNPFIPASGYGAEKSDSKGNNRSALQGNRSKQVFCPGNIQ